MVEHNGSVTFRGQTLYALPLQGLSTNSQNIF